jgi:hypothetical protein
MKIKQHSFLTRLTAAVCTTLLTAFTILPLSALDVQSLPIDSRAASGFTHAARVTWDDLNAADASVVTVQLFAIPTNSYIDRVGFYVEEYFTNSTIANTNLVLNLGVGGTTNRFIGSNNVDGASTRLLSGTGIQMLSTNLLVAYKSIDNTNYLIATFSDGTATAAVDNYVVGKIRIYWRLVDLSRIRF